MSKMSKLFRTRKKKIYSLDDELFFEAMKENCLFHYKNNAEYKKILDNFRFDPNSLKSYDDLANIPFLPTLYFKHHNLLSLPKRKYLIKATSSGTSGKNVSLVGFTLGDLLRGWNMVKSVFAYHKLWSLRPHRYIVFGYEPHKGNDKAIAKTAYGFTLVTPAISKDYLHNLSDDKALLDVCENIRDQDLQLFLISFVELNIDLDALEIDSLQLLKAYRSNNFVPLADYLNAFTKRLTKHGFKHELPTFSTENLPLIDMRSQG